MSPARPKGSKLSPVSATYARRADYPDGEHPVRAYLVGLGGDSERVTLGALDSIADILSGGKVSALELAWHGLRHLSVLRTSSAAPKASKEPLHQREVLSPRLSCFPLASGQRPLIELAGRGFYSWPASRARH